MAYKSVGLLGDSVEFAPLDTGWTPDPAAVLAGPASNVSIEGKPAILAGDVVTSHSKSGTTHPASTMQATQSKVKINGIPVCVDGDLPSCNHGLGLAASSSKVKING